jgi:hypothetical protein
MTTPHTAGVRRTRGDVPVRLREVHARQDELVSVAAGTVVVGACHV